MNKKLNWGILGLGNIAHSFAKSFDLPDGQLYGAASRTLDKAQTFTKEFNIPRAYGSYAQLLADPDIDIVYIATPHNYHLESILASLNAGKHVFCEKAITMNSYELKQAEDLATQKHLVLMEAQTIYHMPVYQAIKQTQETAGLGKLKTIDVTFGSHKEFDPKNRFFNPELAGGAMLDIGVYALSFARNFLTATPQLLATKMIPAQTGTDDQSSILLTNTNNEFVTVNLNFQAKMPKRGTLVYENGYVVVEDYPRADSAMLTFTNGDTKLIAAGEHAQAMNYEAADMQKVVNGLQTDYWGPMTQDVMQIMTQTRKAWNFYYPFEDPAKFEA